MQRNQTRHPRTRLPNHFQMSDTDKTAKADLTRLLTMGHGEDILRDHVKKEHVKVTEHLVRLVRRDPVIARKVAVCLLGRYGVPAIMSPMNGVDLCIAETSIECRENALEARYQSRLCDSAEKAELADAITLHIAALEALRDCVCADIEGRIPGASL